MSFIPYLDLFVFWVYVGLSVFIWIRNPKSWLNRSAAFFLGSFAVWTFGLITTHSPHAHKGTVIFFDNISSLGYISFSSFILWFTLLFTQKKKLLKKKWLHFALFALPALFIVKKWTGDIIADYAREWYGWAAVWADSAWLVLFNIYFLSFLAASVLLLISFAKKSGNPIEKRQAKVMSAAIVTATTLGWLVNGLLPLLKIYMIPNEANIFGLIWAGGVVYAIARYRFLTLTPATAAENLLATMINAFFLLDKEGRVVQTNRAAEVLSGYSEEELKGNSMGTLLSSERDQDFVERARRENAFRYSDCFLKTRDGREVPVILSISALKERDGLLPGLVCVVSNITELKEKEEKLRESEEHYRALFERVPAGLYRTSPSGEILDVNPGFVEILDFPDKESLIKTLAQDRYESEDDRGRWKKLIDRKSVVRNYEHQVKQYDGKRIWVRENARAVRMSREIRP